MFRLHRRILAEYNESLSGFQTVLENKPQIELNGCKLAETADKSHCCSVKSSSGSEMKQPQGVSNSL